MSKYSPAAPDSRLNERFSRKVQEERREEAQLEIFEEEEQHADLSSQKARQPAATRHAAVRRSWFRAAAVTLTLIHLLTLTGIFTRYILAGLEKDRLQRNFDELSNNHSLLQDEVKQLEEKISEMRLNNPQTITEQHDMCCPDGWRRFGCSCYFKSTERQKWEESRRDCQSRDADLVIINSREEQEFVRELNGAAASWIGLKAEYKHQSTGWEPKWEWVDGSPLTVMFWESGHSLKTWHKYVECCSKQGKWTQSRHYNSNYWICEIKSCCVCRRGSVRR